MIVLYVDDTSDGDRIRQALSRFTTVTLDRRLPVTDLPSDQRVTLATAACVVHSHGPRGLHAALSRIESISTLRPAVPQILVTLPTASLAKRVASIRLAALVWTRDVERELQHRVAVAVLGNEFSEIAEVLRDAGHPPALARALRLAVLASTPFRTVGSLARAARVAPSTLRHQFYSVVQTNFRLEDFLSAIQLLHSFRLRSVGVSWDDAAKAVGVSTRTLYNKARIWPGCTLFALGAVEPAELLSQFRAAHLTPLLNRPRH